MLLSLLFLLLLLLWPLVLACLSLRGGDNDDDDDDDDAAANDDDDDDDDDLISLPLHRCCELQFVGFTKKDKADSDVYNFRILLELMAGGALDTLLYTSAPGRVRHCLRPVCFHCIRLRQCLSLRPPRRSGGETSRKWSRWGSMWRR